MKPKEPPCWVTLSARYGCSGRGGFLHKHIYSGIPGGVRVLVRGPVGAKPVCSLFGPGLLDGLEWGHLSHRFVVAWAEPRWGKVVRAAAHAIPTHVQCRYPSGWCWVASLSH